MKPEIHPDYKKVTVICNCGNSFVTKSTYRGDEMRVDVCNDCHPFYTGKHKVVDTAGRIEQFQRRYGTAKKDTDAQPATDK
jgi:large subunit ribosomal protein L31